MVFDIAENMNINSVQATLHKKLIVSGTDKNPHFKHKWQQASIE